MAHLEIECLHTVDLKHAAALVDYVVLQSPVAKSRRPKKKKKKKCTPRGCSEQGPDVMPASSLADAAAPTCSAQGPGSLSSCCSSGSYAMSHRRRRRPADHAEAAEAATGNTTRRSCVTHAVLLSRAIAWSAYDPPDHASSAAVSGQHRHGVGRSYRRAPEGAPAACCIDSATRTPVSGCKPSGVKPARTRPDVSCPGIQYQPVRICNVYSGR